MGKVCILSNAKNPDYIAERFRGLYPDGEEFYVLPLENGFSQHLQLGTTEILFSGGTAIRLSAHPELRDEIFTFITTATLPIIGVCFGAQLIARAAGSAIVQLPAVRAGHKAIRIVKDKAAFNNKYIAQVYKKQHWSLQDLPHDFEVYAVSAEGIEMFVHRAKPVAGVQFHPEQFTQITDGPMIFKALRAKLQTLAAK